VHWFVISMLMLMRSAAARRRLLSCCRNEARLAIWDAEDADKSELLPLNMFMLEIASRCRHNSTAMMGPRTASVNGKSEDTGGSGSRENRHGSTRSLYICHPRLWLPRSGQSRIWSHQILASFHFPAATRENLASADQGKYRVLGITDRPLPTVPLAPIDDPFTPQMGAAESPPRSTPPITTAANSGTQRSPPFLGECNNGCMITNRKPAFSHCTLGRYSFCLLRIRVQLILSERAGSLVRLFLHALRLSQCQPAPFGNRSGALGLSMRFPLSTDACQKVQPCKNNIFSDPVARPALEFLLFRH